MKKKYFSNYILHQYENYTNNEFNFSSTPTVDAIYIEQELPERANNSLIEALPPPLTNDSAIFEALRKKPIYDDSEKNKDIYYRSQACDRIEFIAIPTPESLQAYKTIDTCIRQGYTDKSFFDKKYFDQLRSKNNYVESNSQLFNLKSGCSILGISSGGKTTAINSILKLYPQVIIHCNNGIVKSCFYQIVWLKIDCPHDATRGGLCGDILILIDHILNTDYASVYKRSSVEVKLAAISQLFYKYRVGVLVIDEIQFLTKSKDALILLNFFVHLNNIVGVPVVTIGNYDAYDGLFHDFKQAKRVVGNNFIQMPSFNIEKFQNFVEMYWKYQWTKTETPLTDELLAELYIQSGGIPGLSIKLYRAAQIEAVGSKNEKITTKLIEKVKMEKFRPLVPFTQALLSDNPSEYCMYSDIRVQKQLQMSSQIKKSKEKAENRNVVQIKFINDVEESILAYLENLGIDELSISESGIDIKYMINAYLGKKPEEICNLVSTKILQILKGDKTENKPSKEEVDQMLCDLEENIIDKL